MFHSIRRAFERAVRRSGLPALTRHVLITLASHTDDVTGVIPAEYSPTFATLVSETGMSRSTLAAHLARAESAGWLTRDAPSKQAALRNHTRTQYALTVPAGIAQDDELQPVPEADTTGSAREPRPVRETNTIGSGGEPVQVPTPVREPNRSGSGAEHRSFDDVDRSDQDLLTTIQNTIRQTTGREVSLDWAALVRRDIIGNRADVRTPTAYVATCIRRDPARFIPTVPEPNGELPVPRVAPVGERDNPANGRGAALARRLLAGAGAR